MIGSFKSLDFMMGFPETPSHSNLEFSVLKGDWFWLGLMITPFSVPRAAEEFDWNRVSFVLEAGAIKTYVQNLCSKFMFKTYVQNLCLYKIYVQNIYSKQNLCSKLLFKT